MTKGTGASTVARATGTSWNGETVATVESYATGAGVRYMVRYRKPNGVQTKKRGFTTKAAAKAFGTKIENAKLDGLFIDPAKARVTIGDLGPAWLKRQASRTKPSGHRAVESAWRIHVEPRWSDETIGSIVHTDVADWLTELTDERGLGATVVHTCHSILARILDDAVSDGRIAKNPARGVKLPARKRKAKHKYLTHEQVDQLADESKYPELIYLLAYCGPRWGEVAALRPVDFDFGKRRVRLHENAVMVGSETIVGTLKNNESRTVPLPEFVSTMLAEHAAARPHDGLMWPARDGGYMGPPASHDSWLSGAVSRCIAATDKQRTREADETDGKPTTRAFPRVTAHDLRHTAASLAISAGANVKAVQRMLGHSSAAMTLDTYADLFDDDLDAVADALDRAHKTKRAQNVPTLALVR